MAALSSDEHFQRVLAVAADQLRTKKIQIRFGPQGRMRFIIDDESLKTALAKAALDEPTFRGIFDNEIGPLFDAIIRGTLDQYVENAPGMALYGEDAKKQAATKELMRSRGGLVSQTLVNDQLRARYVIKASSKHPRLRTSGWEIGKKTGLSTKETWLRPYATLSFETIWPESSGFLAWFPFFPIEGVGRTESMAFDCDEDDLDDLIQALQDAKAALRKAEA
jgi:hypothetical protein